MKCACILSLPGAPISENDWGLNAKITGANSFLTMQRHRPNVTIYNYWGGGGARATPKVGRTYVGSYIN